MKRDQVRNVVRSTNKLVLTGRANGYRVIAINIIFRHKARGIDISIVLELGLYWRRKLVVGVQATETS